MKKTLALTFILTVLLCLFCTVDSSAATSGYLVYTVRYGEATITKCNTSASGNVTIPSKLGGYPVTTIAEEAFNGCSGITSITIPNGVTMISPKAFKDCIGLTSATIPNSVIRIGNSAFENCTSLTSIVIPNSVTKIENRTFLGCTKLKSITIPSNVTSIQYYAFADCCDLTDITIPNSVTSIGECAFENCTSLTSIVIPNSVTTVYDKAFACCYNLTNITIPDNITFYGKSVFYDTGYYNNINNWENDVLYIGSYLIEAGFDLSGSYNIKKGTKSVSEYAFENCTNLTSIVIPNSVTSIGAYAFSYCTSLTSITIPNSITRIYNHTFYNCQRLTSIAIPKSVSVIVDRAFEGCPIEKVYYAGSKDYWQYMIDSDNYELMYAQIFFNIDIEATRIETEKGIFFVDGTTLKDYAGSDTVITIPNSITKIGDYAFSNCDSLTTIAIPDSVTSIGDNAFAGCTSLTCITIPDSVTSIGDDAFWKCTSLTSITIPNSITTINDSTFRECTNLSRITIPSGVTSIGDNAFHKCTNLSSITIPDSIISIGEGAFDWCNNLGNVYITNIALYCKISFDGVLGTTPSVPTKYGATLYLNGKPITNLIIPDSVTSIGAYTFYGCTNITNVTIPDSVTSIGAYAFGRCTSLTSITIPDSIIYSYENVFYDCTNLKSIKIPYLFSGLPISIEKITITKGTDLRDNALSGYINLKEIVLPDSLTHIGENAFKNCNGLMEISIPNNVKSIETDAFTGCNNLSKVYITDLSKWCNINFSSTKSNPLYFAKNLYLNGSLIEELTIPDGISSIKDYTFYGATGLKGVRIPNSVTAISEDAFSGCSNLSSVHIDDLSAWCNIDFKSQTSNPLYYAKKLYVNGTAVDTLTFPKGINQIKPYTFINSSITKLIVPDNISMIDKTAFQGCNFLVDITTPYIFTNLPNSVVKLNITNTTSIQDSALNGYDKLKEIILPEEIESIGANAFKGCSNLLSITIPDRVKSIGNNAFNECNSLTNIIVPESVTSIGTDVFAGCNNITKIQTPFVFDNVPSSVEELIITNANKIGDLALSGCSNLKQIIFPKNLQIVGRNAFKNCRKLTSITIPDSVTSIGLGAFSGCDGLTKVTLPFIGASANATGKEALFGYIFGEAQYDGSYAVRQVYDTAGNTALFYIPDALRQVDVTNASKVEYGAFNNCMNLSEVHIYGDVTTVGRYAFAGCDMLSKVYLPDSITTIGGYTFDNSINVTLYGKGGSYVQTYAERSNIPFVVVEDSAFTAQKNIRNNNIVVTATLPTATLENVLYVACYDDNDKFLKLVIKEYYTNCEEILISNDSNISYIKVFLWESLSNLKPLANAVILDM